MKRPLFAEGALRFLQIRRLINKYNLKCPIPKANPYSRMAMALRTSNMAPNLLNHEFHEHGMRKVLQTNIIYLPFGNGQRDVVRGVVLAQCMMNHMKVEFDLLKVKNIRQSFSHVGMSGDNAWSESFSAHCFFF